MISNSETWNVCANAATRPICESLKNYNWYELYRRESQKQGIFISIFISPSGSWDMRSRGHPRRHQALGSHWVRGASWVPSELGVFWRISSLLFPTSPAVEYTRRVISHELRAYRRPLHEPGRHRYRSSHCGEKTNVQSRKSSDDTYRVSHWDQSRSAPVDQRMLYQGESWSLHTRVLSPVFTPSRGQRIRS